MKSNKSGLSVSASGAGVVAATSGDGPFKRPMPPKRRTTVLEETDYLEKIESIIQRDFFPDLPKVRAQNEYLDAVANNDFVKVRQIHAKYNRSGSERLQSPATFDTPADERPHTGSSWGGVSVEGPRENRAAADPAAKRDSAVDKCSLDSYLANHTSEDNQSFDDILAEAELRHKRKFSWLYQEKGAAEQGSQEKRLSLQSSDGTPSVRPLNVDTWDYRDKNYVMYVPDGVTLTAEEVVERAKRRQQISHSSTRFHSKPFDESENKERIQDLAMVQARAQDGKIGVDGKEVTSEMPRVGGYSFVATPSPAPGVDSTPLMTWGEIEGTPFRLDGSDVPRRSTPGPSFSMAEPPTREKIAHLLSDRVSVQHRDKKKRAMEAATRQFGSSPLLYRPGSLDRLQMLSPAARKMSSSFTRLSSDKKLSSFYSPSPQRTAPSTPASSLSSTPKADGTPAHAVLTTDNLLNISVKRRPAAADFFQ